MKRCPLLALQVDQDIQLRLLEDRHAEAYFTLLSRNRTHLRQWIGWMEFEPELESTRAFLQQALLEFARNETFQTGIWWQNQLVGTIDLSRFQWQSRRAELGYLLSADAQGQGIATRSCRALINYAFSDYQLNKIEIRCATGNIRSRALAERLGFQQEGTLRQAEILHGHPVDYALYGLLKDEWLAYFV